MEDLKKRESCRGKCPYVLIGAEREELALPRSTISLFTLEKERLNLW